MNPAAARCVAVVLRALATVAATPAMRDLAVLDEDRPVWAGADTFPAAVLDLLGRRAARFGPVIRGRLPDFDRRYTAARAPRAPTITSALTAQFARDVGYPADVLLTYQAAYAVATSNAFAADGSDGHFAWCLDQLRRPDVTDLLGR